MGTSILYGGHVLACDYRNCDAAQRPIHFLH